MVRLRRNVRKETFGRDERQYVAQFVATGVPGPWVKLSGLLRWRDPPAFVRRGYQLAHSYGKPSHLLQGSRSSRSSKLGLVQIVYPVSPGSVSETSAYTYHAENRRPRRFQERSENVGRCAERIGKHRVRKEQRRNWSPGGRRLRHDSTKFLGAQSFQLRATYQERTTANSGTNGQSLHFGRGHQTSSLWFKLERDRFQVLHAQSEASINQS